MKQRYSRREWVQSASAAAGLTGAWNSALAAPQSEPEYARMPPTEEIFGWIETLWQFGDRDKYRYRMPGSHADHQAAAFLEQKFREFGLRDVRRELVPIPVMLPNRWTLTVNARGKSEDIPCWFVPYAAPTPPEGITGELVFVGRGSKEEFQANAARVAGNIAVVDLFSTGIPMNNGMPPIRDVPGAASYFVYDPNHTLEGDMYSETSPVNNQTSSTALARRYGAVGYIGILNFRAKDVCQQYHGPKDANGVICGLTVSPSSGARIKELLAGGAVKATLVLTQDPGKPIDAALSATRTVAGPDGPLAIVSTTYGNWGHTYNVYGVLPGASDEVVVVLSHHDGGATNEASGASVVLALAKYFAQSPARNRRKTLMFVLFGSHFGLRPPLLDGARGIAAVKDKIACSIGIEMIGRQYKLRDGKYVSTGLASPALIGVRDGNPRLVSYVREAIVKHKLDRSFITNHILGEGGVMATQGGVMNVIEYSSLSAPQFSLEDRPETVNKEALRPTACAFADVIGRIDPVAAKDLGTAPRK